MDHSALLTDLTALHVLRALRASAHDDTAVFDFVVRSMPAGRNFLVAAGIEETVDYLTGMRFGDDDLAWLAHEGGVPLDVVHTLADLRFTGDVDALPEGTVFFPDEPVVRVSAPLVQAAIVECRLVSILQYAILVASKAVRCVLAAQGRTLVDYGLRRAHGADAALIAARATFLAGFDATATLLAARRYGIPAAGAPAHAFIQAHASEDDAFAALARGARDGTTGGCTLPVDTYDVPRALAKVVALAQRLHQEEGGRIGAVHIDSGDLAAQARLARGVLDEGGCQDVRITVSGDLDEAGIAALVAGGAPIDGFGAGTRVATSADVPYLDCACKLAEFAGHGRRKRVPGKASWPGCKQVYRCRDDDGILLHDTLGLEMEAVPGTPLLEPVLRGGARVGPCWSLSHLRQTVRTHLAGLPAPLRGLAPAQAPPVLTSHGLVDLACVVDRHSC